ncbi:hypothetical protein CF319_g7207 [Tilletia indica]|nr:hypothetical protein CF319_g7207 [Tilletia indica]
MLRAPLGPMAGLSDSQPITVADSQESTVSSSHRSDSPTTSSHRNTSDNDNNNNNNNDDDSFIDDGSQSLPATQQSLPSASQDLAGLSPAGSLSATRSIPRADGFYRMDEEEEDLSEYETLPVNTTAPEPSVTSTPHLVPTAVEPTTPPRDTMVAEEEDPSPTPTPGTTDPAPPAAATTAAGTRTGNYLDGERLYRTDRMGHPEIPWSVVKEGSESKSFPPVGTIWYRLPAWFRLDNQAHTFLLQGYVLDHIKESGITFPASDFFSLGFRGTRIKNLVFGCAMGSVLTDLRSMVFPIPSIDGNAPFVLENPMVGLAMGARYLPVHCFLGGTPASTGLAILQTQLHARRQGGQGAWVVEAWSINMHTGPPPAPKHPQNQLVALIYVAPPRGGNYSSPLTRDDFLAMVHWLGPEFLAFPGRLRCCRSCHGQFEFHLNEQCLNANVICAVCNRPDTNHTGATCPKRRSLLKAPGATAEEDTFEDEEFIWAPTGPLASSSMSAFPPPSSGTSTSQAVVPTDDSASLPLPNDTPTFSIVTLNCGHGGLRARLFELSTGASSLLGSASVLCIQECNTLPAIWTDPKSIQDALRLSSPPPFRAILGTDAGIIVRDASLSITAYATGPRWAHVLLTSSSPIVDSHTQIALWSIHGPFTTSAWEPIATAIRDHPAPPDTPVFIGADWNAVPDPLLDSLTGTPTGVPWSAPAFAIAPTDTIDLFRSLRPVDRSWTFARTTSLADGSCRVSARRLDSIWGPALALPFVLRTSVCSTSSDHRAVGVSFASLTAPTVAPGASSLPAYRPWSLHPGLWNDPAFVTSLRHFADTYHPPTDLSTDTPVIVWRAFHAELRDFLRPLSRRGGTSQILSRLDLDASRAALDSLDLRHPEAAVLLPHLLHRWRAATSAASAAAHLRPGGHTTASALRAGSWLYSSHRSASTRAFPPLRTPAGLTASPQEQLDIFTAFYQDLFAPRPPSPLTPTACETLLATIQLRLTPPVAASIGAPFTISELLRALRTANRHSSAGPDGVPYRVYLETFTASGPRLLDLANALGSGAVISLSARTVILSKSGDPSDPSNYRPITISDAYVRLISRLVSGRLLHVGDSLLPWTQAAFLPGRRSSLVAGVLHGLSDLLRLPASSLCPPAMVIISLDQRKAYDRVDRTWLFAVLRAVGLPSFLINVLSALYSNPVTRISALGTYGTIIRMLIGVLQGDASSCILYNLSLQPLFDLLASLNIGVPVPLLGTLSSLAFADDSLLFLAAAPLGLTQLPYLLHCLTLYSLASGAALNLSKSTFWIYGTPAPEHADSVASIVAALTAFGLSPSAAGGPTTHLGHPLPLRDPSNSSSAPLLTRLAAIRSRAACFRTVGVDLVARVQFANRFLGSRLWHTITVGPLPPHFSSLFRDAVRPYLLGKHVSVSPANLTRASELGGYGLIDADAMATALSISFLRRFLLAEDRLGSWLRAGLVTYLAHRHHVPPAILLVRSGRAFRDLCSLNTRADGFFGRLIHALATVDLGLSPTWTELPAAALLTLPWRLPWVPTNGFPSLSSVKLADLRRKDWITWGDVLWRCGVHIGVRHRSVSHPLGPPPGRSVVLNGLRSPFSQQRPLDGPGLADIWPSLWTSLPHRVRSTLAALSSSAAFTGLPDATVTVSKGWVPLRQDPLAHEFPWHLLTVHGVSLAATSTASVRRAVQAGPPRTPGWADPDSVLSPAVWARTWADLARLPLSSSVRTTSLLILNRTIWLHQVAKRPAPCPLGCLRPSSLLPKDDSPTHGYFGCPAAAAVWEACLPLLTSLGCPAPPNLTAPALIAASAIPPGLRPRFALWRSACCK